MDKSTSTGMSGESLLKASLSLPKGGKSEYSWATISAVQKDGCGGRKFSM